MRVLIFTLLVSVSLIATSCFEEEICSPNPCQNDGVCSETLDSYECECATGFTGDNCEIKQCSSDDDCSSDKVCESGLCVEKKLGCQTDADCSSNEYCSDRNVCLEKPSSCQSDTDCFNGFHCELMDCDDESGLDCANAGVCVKDPFVCEDVTCNLYCENGFKKDSDGCDICECVEETKIECESDSDCFNGFHCELVYCADGITDCGNGGVCVKDEFECPDVMCNLYCENGFKKDSDGCDICECIEELGCVTDADCEADQYCELLDGCFVDETGELNCPQEGVCVDNEVMECQTDSDCFNGFHCEGLLGCYVDESGELNCPDGGECVKDEVECQTSSDCAVGETCELNSEGYGVCIDDSPTQCSSDNTCANNEICEEGICVSVLGCQTDNDCLNGFHCEMNVCIEDVNPPACDCYDAYEPVCGVNGLTYGNDCEASCANIEIAYEGVCR